MTFHDTELRYTHPELFRNDDAARALAELRLNARPGIQVASAVKAWLNGLWPNSRPGLRPRSKARQA